MLAELGCEGTWFLLDPNATAAARGVQADCFCLSCDLFQHIRHDPDKVMASAQTLTS